MTIEEFKNKPSRLLLALLSAFPSIYAVLFTPSFPLLTNYFNISFTQSELPMTSFLIGYACGSLFYGPLCNRFGRKPILHLGISIAIISCFLCILAEHTHSFSLFLFGRFLMAVGSCSGLNIAFTIVGDIYTKSHIIKIFSFIMLFSAIIPNTATFIGGLIIQNLGWKNCFYFLIFFGCMMLILTSYLLQETARRCDSKALKFKKTIMHYARECKNTQLILSAIITGCGSSIIYLFASTAPFVGITLIGLSPDQYGIWAFIPALGLAIGSLFTRSISNHFVPKQLLWIGRKILLTATFFFMGAFYFGHINPWSLFFPMLCIDIGLASVFTMTAAIAIDQAKDKAIGASLMCFINLSVCFLFVNALGMISIQTPVILPLLFIFLVLLISFLMSRLEKSISTEWTIL